MVLSLLYFILPLLCLFTNYIKLPNGKLFKILLLTIVILFQCSGYMTGSDWRTYEEAYYSDLNIRFLYWEPGFRWLVSLFSGYVNFWSFNISIKIVCFISLLYLIKTFSKHFWLVLSLYLLTSSNYLFIDCPLRNLIAYSFVWTGSVFLFYKKKKTALFFYLCSILFHYSIILTIPMLLLLLLFRRLSLLNSFYLTITLMLFFNKIFIENIVSFIFKIIGISKGLHYIGTNYGNSLFAHFVSVKFLLIAILVLFVLRHKRLLSLLDNKKELIYVSLIYFFSSYLANSIQILSRVAYCFEPYFWICVVNAINVLNKKERYFYPVFLFILLSISTFRFISSTNKYIPYTNYFITTFSEGKELDYNYRNRYNMLNSPFKGED